MHPRHTMYRRRNRAKHYVHVLDYRLSCIHIMCIVLAIFLSPIFCSVYLLLRERQPADRLRTTLASRLVIIAQWLVLRFSVLYLSSQLQINWFLSLIFANFWVGTNATIMHDRNKTKHPPRLIPVQIGQVENDAYGA